MLAKNFITYFSQLRHFIIIDTNKNHTVVTK